jgi:hypothetical protein
MMAAAGPPRQSCCRKSIDWEDREDRTDRHQAVFSLCLRENHPIHPIHPISPVDRSTRSPDQEHDWDYAM